MKIISEMQHCQKYVCSIGVGWNKYVYAYYRITVLGKHNSPSGLSFDQLNPIRCNFIYHRWKNSQNAPFNKKYVQLLPNICKDLTNICNAFLFFWNLHEAYCKKHQPFSNKKKQNFIIFAVRTLNKTENAFLKNGKKMVKTGLFGYVFPFYKRIKTC